jgi:UDP-glucose 4-epimerase
VIRKIAGSASPITHREGRLGDIRRSLGDPARAVAELGVSARTGVEDGLRLTLAGIAGTAG